MIKKLKSKLTYLGGRFYRGINRSVYSQETPSPNHLNIEISSICNVKCIWCQMQSFKKIKQGFMTLELFTSIIDMNQEYLMRNKMIVEPYFRGEPLLHPKFWEICDVLKKYNIFNGGINTNLSVKIDVKKFLDYEMGVLVNIGGITKDIHEKNMRGSIFDLVTRNLSDLWKLGAKTSVKMNPTKSNVHQISDLPKFVERLGGKKEYIVPYTTCYPIPATATQEEIDTFFKHVISKEIDPYLRFTYDITKDNKGIKAKKPGCNFLTDVIFFDGQFSICCHDQLQLINLGNVFENKIEDIRHLKEYEEAVKTAKKCGYSFCKECN